MRLRLTLSPQCAARLESMARDSETASQSICRLINDEWRRRAMQRSVVNPPPGPVKPLPNAPAPGDTSPRALFYRARGYYPEASP